MVVKKHRTILLGWPTLLVVGLAFTLMVSNSLAIRLVWVQAEVTFEGLRRVWMALVVVVILGGLMVFLDCKAILRVWHFDREALEKVLDRAESWLTSWMAPALRIVTFGFINPRKIVGEKVHQAFVDANWVLIGGMHRYSIGPGCNWRSAFPCGSPGPWPCGDPADETAVLATGKPHLLSPPLPVQ